MQYKYHWPVWSSFLRTIRYHLGTIAFGSLIIAIVQMIRLTLLYLEKTMKRYSDNQFCKCMFKMLQYCLACAERFLKFISRNAYVMVR